MKTLRKDLPVLSRPGRAGKPSRSAAGGLRQLLRETKSELKRVTWPTREQTRTLTGVVIAVAVAMGIFLGTVDYVFSRLFELILTGGF